MVKCVERKRDWPTKRMTMHWRAASTRGRLLLEPRVEINARTAARPFFVTSSERWDGARTVLSGEAFRKWQYLTPPECIVDKIVRKE